MFFIEGKLFLKVNREKTMIAYIKDIEFLGYTFYVYGGKGCLRVHPKSLAKLMDFLRVLMEGAMVGVMKSGKKSSNSLSLVG